MNTRLLLDVARSLMMARWRQTLVAAVGVTFGITMFVTLLGFMHGLNDLLDGLILNRTPHIRLFTEVKPSLQQPIQEADKNTYTFMRSVKPAGKDKQIMNAAAIMQTLKEDSRVLGIAPKASAQVFYNVGNIDINGVINGIDPLAEERLFNFKDYVPEGNIRDLNLVPNSIILGKAAAQKMMAAIGDVIQVTTPQGERQSLKVVGFFQSGLQDLDKVQSYCSLATTQKLLGKDASYITDINIKLFDINSAPPIALEYARIFETDAEDIQTANAQFETGSDVRSIISYAVGVTLLIVAGFGIYNILNMMIYEKMDSIAILKATGFSGRDVQWIFTVIALAIGLVGGLAGLFFGLLMSFGIDQVPFNTAALPTVKTFPVNYDPIFYLIAISFSLITTYFAGFFPARKASEIDPVIIIRGK